MHFAMQFLVFSIHRMPPSPRYRFFNSTTGLAGTPRRANPSRYGYSGMFHLPLAPCQYYPTRAVIRKGAREAMSSHNTVAMLTVQAKDPSAVGIWVVIFRVYYALQLLNWEAGKAEWCRYSEKRSRRQTRQPVVIAYLGALRGGGSSFMRLPSPACTI